MVILKIETMKKLTLNYATKNKFTPMDCIRYFNPKWTDEQCDFHLWEKTCFPFSGDIFIEQLNTQFFKLIIQRVIVPNDSEGTFYCEREGDLLERCNTECDYCKDSKK